ncbi:hypothetical protein D3C81_2125950 [compost metagenome]
MATMSMAIMDRLDRKSIKVQITITQMRIRFNKEDRLKVVTMMTNIQTRIITMIPTKI